MRINYDNLQLTPKQEATIIRTIYRNPFIPIKPYREQLFAIASQEKRKLIGGSAFSGKSILGAMLALQYFEVPNYRALVIRRTYDDVIATGGIIDYIKEWTADDPRVDHNKMEKCFTNLETGAKIYYNYALYAEDRNKFKSRQFHRIIVDEASEVLKVILQFFNRSLRPNEERRIPLGLYYISNPAASTGIEYLNENFVKGKYPYYEMNFWDNPYIDAEDYKETLSELSTADYQFQMGNWDYKLKAGDIFDYDTLTAAKITRERYNELRDLYPLLLKVRGWDIAATETQNADYTASSLIEVYQGGPKIVTEQESFKLKPGRLEDRMRQTMERDGPEVEQWIEKQPAAAGKLLARYWKKEFEDYKPKMIAPHKTKVTRAGKLVPYLKRLELLFLEGDYIGPFFDQCVNFPVYNKLTADDPEALHDDRIDTVSMIINRLEKKTKVFI